MFRLPIASAFRISVLRQPPTPSLSIHRIRTFTPSSQASSRLFSSSCAAAQSGRPQVPSTRTKPRPSHRIPPQPFASSGHRYYRNGHNKYRRFTGSGKVPFIVRIWRDATPLHGVVIVCLIGGVYFSNLETVEMTGRRRFNCVSHQQELEMGLQNYNELLNQVREQILPDSHPYTIMVNRVLQRLAPLAPIHGANWKVHVIEDDSQMNAFVFPGGKVFVYTGILPICQDEDGLAAVLGHEIAHVVAHHQAERMTHSILKIGLMLFTAILFDITGQIPSMLFNMFYGLPNSRTQEVEADKIGLMLMSKACFNPAATVALWARMQKAEKTTPLQFLSTHPSSYNRMEAINGWLDEARVIYEKSGCSSTETNLSGFRQARGRFAEWLRFKPAGS